VSDTGTLAVTAAAGASQDTALILHTTELRADGGVAKETWTDLAHLRARTFDYDEGGSVVAQHVTSIAGGQGRTDTVLYPAKQWMTRTFAVPPTARDVGVTGSGYFPAQIREREKLHLISVIGRQTIKGKKTLRLRDQTGALGQEIWVEPTTYIAVKAVETYGPTTKSLAFDWLMPTRANQAKLKLVVPRGFEHIA
jgi:hypothetical protein